MTELKIDIEFIRGLTRDPANQRVVKSIVSAARHFDITTVAEGVEDEDTVELLRTLGVDMVQGYYVGYPSPISRPGPLPDRADSHGEFPSDHEVPVPVASVSLAARGTHPRTPADETKLAVARGLFEAIADGDRDAVLAALDPAVEWVPTVWSGTTAYGHDGVLEWMLEFGEGLALLEVELEALEQHGDRVLALGTIFDTRGDKPFTTRVGWIFGFRGDLIVHGRAYPGWAAARAAADGVTRQRPARNHPVTARIRRGRSTPPAQGRRRSGWIAGVDVERALRLTNRNMIGFDLILGTAALTVPDATLRALGHDEPSPDARHLFRRCGPIWLTFAAAHLVAERRGPPRGLVGARMAARNRARDRRRLVALRVVLAPGRSGRHVARGGGQPGDGRRLRPTRPRALAPPRAARPPALAANRRERPAADREADLPRDPVAFRLALGELVLRPRVGARVTLVGRRPPGPQRVDPALARIEVELDLLVELRRPVERADPIELVRRDPDQLIRELRRLARGLRGLSLQVARTPDGPPGRSRRRG